MPMEFYCRSLTQLCNENRISVDIAEMESREEKLIFSLMK